MKQGTLLDLLVMVRSNLADQPPRCPTAGSLAVDAEVPLRTGAGAAGIPHAAYE